MYTNFPNNEQIYQIFHIKTRHKRHYFSRIDVPWSVYTDAILKTTSFKIKKTALKRAVLFHFSISYSG